MKRNRGFSRTARRMVRPVDWDYAQVNVSLAGDNIAWDWLRVPSDSQDPSQNDLLVRPKTLVRTNVFYQSETAITQQHVRHAFYFGIIPWSGRDSTPPAVAADLPNPTVGSNDWVFWQPGSVVSTVGNTFGFATAGLSSNGSNPSGPFWTSRAQRKLPAGVGLLWVAYYFGPSGSITDATIDIRMALKGDYTAPGLGGE